MTPKTLELLEKRLNGERLTQAEERHLDKFEAAETVRLGKEYIASVPRADYQSYAGKTRSVIDRHRDRYKVPLHGRNVSVVGVIAWLHELLDQHGDKLLEGVTQADTLPIDDQSRYVRAKADNEEINRDVKLRALVKRDDVHDMLTRWANVIKTTGEKLGQKFGQDAQQLVEAALDTCQTLLDDVCDDSGGSPTND